MDQQSTSPSNSDSSEEFSIVIVPEHLRKQVMEYVADLVRSEPDVSGYMLSAPVLGSSPISRTLMDTSGTGCKFVSSPKGLDWQCSDGG